MTDYAVTPGANGCVLHTLNCSAVAYQIEQGARVLKLFNCDVPPNELGIEQHFCLHEVSPSKAELKAEVERAYQTYRDRKDFRP
jgi:hypothetical protein